MKKAMKMVVEYSTTYGGIFHHLWWNIPPPMVEYSATYGGIFHHPMVEYSTIIPPPWWNFSNYSTTMEGYWLCSNLSRLIYLTSQKINMSHQSDYLTPICKLSSDQKEQISFISEPSNSLVSDSFIWFRDDNILLINFRSISDIFL